MMHREALRFPLQLVPLFLLLAGMPGCGDGERTINDVQRAETTIQEVVDQLKAKGGEATKKTYQLGDAWVIKLAGAKIDDETLGLLKRLNRIAELDLSGSSITDEQMKKIAADAGGLLYKLDISKTGLTDATMDALADRVLLSEVIATGSKITQAGITKFRTARQSNRNVRVKNTTVKL